MKKLTPDLLRRMVLEEKKKVEAAHAKQNAKAKKDLHLEEEGETHWADADVPAKTEYKPGSKDMEAAKMLKEEEMRLRARLRVVVERRLELKRRIMESL
jgi:hypothetical protein